MKLPSMKDVIRLEHHNLLDVKGLCITAERCGARKFELNGGGVAYAFTAHMLARTFLAENARLASIERDRLQSSSDKQVIDELWHVCGHNRYHFFNAVSKLSVGGDKP